MNTQNGLTLLELIITIVIIGILVGFVQAGYARYIRQARLAQAHAALMENARFLEDYYRRNFKFKKNSTTWPELPIKQTDAFCIRIQGQARGAPNNKFTLKAVAFDKTVEPRALRLNQDVNATICESTKSTCDEQGVIFVNKNGTDKTCRIYR